MPKVIDFLVNSGTYKLTICTTYAFYLYENGELQCLNEGDDIETPLDELLEAIEFDHDNMNFEHLGQLSNDPLALYQKWANNPHKFCETLIDRIMIKETIHLN